MEAVELQALERIREWVAKYEADGSRPGSRIASQATCQGLAFAVHTEYRTVHK